MTTDDRTRLILPLPGDEAFAHRLADQGHWELGTIEARQLRDEESCVRPRSDVAGWSAALVCPSRTAVPAIQPSAASA